LDAEDAVLYYEKQLVGLGKRFYNNFLASLNNIQENPFTHSFVKEPVRRFKVEKFPYKIFYIVTDETIFVIGLPHAKRSNAFIKRRLKLI
jgi:toxin ParE1/3/4